MKLVKYKVVKLQEPIGASTHKLEFESVSKHKQSGGFNYGIKCIGTYRECLEEKKRLLEEENDG